MGEGEGKKEVEKEVDWVEGKEVEVRAEEEGVAYAKLKSKRVWQTVTNL